MHLSNESLLVILVVGLVAGWLAGKVMQGSGFGLIGDLTAAEYPSRLRDCRPDRECVYRRNRIAVRPPPDWRAWLGTEALGQTLVNMWACRAVLRLGCACSNHCIQPIVSLRFFVGRCNCTKHG